MPGTQQNGEFKQLRTRTGTNLQAGAVFLVFPLLLLPGMVWWLHLDPRRAHVLTVLAGLMVGRVIMGCPIIGTS